MMEKGLFQSAPVYAGPKIDPRTKLFILAVTNALVLSGKTSGGAFWVRPFLVLLLGGLVFAAGRRAAALGFAAVFIASYAVELLLFEQMAGMGGMLVLLFSTFGFRFLPGAMAVYYMLATTRVNEFVAAMQKMHVPRQITIPLSVMFRFFPTIGEESTAIGNAMRMRGIGRFGAGRSPVEMLEYRMIPLMMSAVKIGDELSASAMTRGLGGPEKRSSLCQIRFSMLDGGLFAIVLAAVIVYVAW